MLQDKFLYLSAVVARHKHETNSWTLPMFCTLSQFKLLCDITVVNTQQCIVKSVVYYFVINVITTTVV